MLDILIKNGVIYDGTGTKGVPMNLGISGERIAYLGTEEPESMEVIDAAGDIVCPGFIDVHSHVDYTIREAPQADNFVMQGITTSMGGHCGMTHFPAPDCGKDDPCYNLANYLAEMERLKVGVNYLPQVGYGPIRFLAMGGDVARPATDAEIEQMKQILRESFDAGAVGFSASYDAATPTHFAQRAEIVELLNVTRNCERLYTPHTKHHQNQWPSDDPKHTAYGLYVGPRGEILTGRYHGLLDVVEQAREIPGLRMMISHLTVMNHIPEPHPAYLDQALVRHALEELVEKPRLEGMDVTFNILPCDSSMGSMTPILDSFFNPILALPDWLKKLNREELLNKLGSRTFRDQLSGFMQSGLYKAGTITPATDPYWGQCYRIIRCKDASFRGRSLYELALDRSPNNRIEALYFHTCEVIFDILEKDPEAEWALVLDKRECGTFEDLLMSPFGFPCTDANGYIASQGAGVGVFGQGMSPAGFNIFPNYLETVVKEQSRMTLEACLHKMTQAPAEYLGIQDRGVLKEGSFADILVFNLDELEASLDFEHPNVGSKGIHHVLINGAHALKNGVRGPVCAGKVLRKL